MPDMLYETDILVWSEQQADLLRRLAAGERVNADVDWANLIDEVETVGRSETRACESYILQATLHLMKLYLRPADYAAKHWRSEIGMFLFNVSRAWTASMRSRLDVQRIYSRAHLTIVQQFEDAVLAKDCPYTLDDLLDPNYEIDTLLAKLG